MVPSGSTENQAAAFFARGLVVDALPAAGFFVVAAFFVAAFADDFAADVPVTDFFTLDAVEVFFVGALVALALGLPARTFLGAVAFAVAALGLVTVLVTLFEEGFVAVFEVGFVTLATDFEAGLEFSFVASALALGASLIFPDAPFGMTKVSESTPRLIASFNCPSCMGVLRLYFSSANLIMDCLETPVRTDSGWAMIHSLIMSLNEG